MTTETVLQEIAAERRRQDERFGGAIHDDEHDGGQLTRAAVNYAAAAAITMALEGTRFQSVPPLWGQSYALDWPWARKWWKPGLVRRMLIKAIALLVAEVDRLDRLPRPSSPAPAEPDAPIAPEASDALALAPAGEATT